MLAAPTKSVARKSTTARVPLAAVDQNTPAATPLSTDTAKKLPRQLSPVQTPAVSKESLIQVAAALEVLQRQAHTQLAATTMAPTASSPSQLLPNPLMVVQREQQIHQLQAFRQYQEFRQLQQLGVQPSQPVVLSPFRNQLLFHSQPSNPFF